MNRTELLQAALQFYSIEIIKIENNHFTIGRGYEIEVERNGLYKLKSDGQIVAPFDDVDELCRFVLL